MTYGEMVFISTYLNDEIPKKAVLDLRIQSAYFRIQPRRGNRNRFMFDFFVAKQYKEIVREYMYDKLYF